jgi:RNA polymerase sigma factor (sigma-70 family)
MANGQWAVVLRHVQRLFHGGSVSGLTEGQLLDRFVSDRDEVAFGALVARHGPMVLGVCRGVLNDPHDVEDAFQATFLVLVRKASGLRDQDLLGPWLYGVARRVSLRARATLSRRKAKERPGIEGEDVPVATLDSELRELQFLIREEVDRLPSNDRMAVVLCYLEGLTHEEAADRLGWPVGTVKGRLSRARDKLRDRLTRRGVALPAAALASTLGRGASASVPLELLRSTTLAATRLAAGQTLTAGIVSAQTLALMEGVIGTMFTTKLKIGAVALVATSVLAVPGVMAYQGFGGQAATKAQAPPQQGPRSDVAKATKAAGPIPDAARMTLVRIAEEALRDLDQLVAVGTTPPNTELISTWSRRLAEAQSGPGVSAFDRKAALQAHLDRMAKLVARSEALSRAGSQTQMELLEARYRHAEALRWVEDGGMGGPPQNPSPAGGGLPGPGGFGGGGGVGMGPIRNLSTLTQTPADEKRNEEIRAKLEAKLSMNFPTETPLEDIKKYIEQATQDEPDGFPTGIPIYIDPNGLKQAETTMSSTITMNLEGIPLGTTLRLMLRQLGLDYRIDGGLVFISDRNSIIFFKK